MYRQIKLATRSSTAAPGAVALLLFAKTPRLPRGYNTIDRTSDHAVSQAIRRAEFTAAKGTITTLYPTRGPKRLLIAGLGEAETFTSNAVRLATAQVVRTAFAARVSHVRLEAMAGIGSKLDPEEAGHAIADGLAIAGFDFSQFKGAANKAEDPNKPLNLTLEAEAALRESMVVGLKIGQGLSTARRLAATPPNVANPAYIVSASRKLARATGLRCTVIDSTKARQIGMGGLLAVGGAGSTPPALICLEHKPKNWDRTSNRRPGDKPRRKGPILLVGKAITFDTGGYSLKTGGSMARMKYDKCGGMAVIGAMEAIARLKLPAHVVGLVPCAENLIDQRAYRVNDIITFCNGVTCEVTNTDAEGRLVLADALAYGTKRYKPAAVIDLATLTGGVVVALGSSCAGLFCNNDLLRKKLEAAARKTGEQVWRLPLWNEHRVQMKGTHADLVNAADRKAHPIQGAAFLSHFVGDQAPKKMPTIPWAHLDIAGVADIEQDPGESALYTKGPTGFGVRLLARLLQAEL